MLSRLLAEVDVTDEIRTHVSMRTLTRTGIVHSYPLSVMQLPYLAKVVSDFF